MKKLFTLLLLLAIIPFYLAAGEDEDKERSKK